MWYYLTKHGVLHQPQRQKRKEFPSRGSGGKHRQARKPSENIALSLDQVSAVFDRVLMGGS